MCHICPPRRGCEAEYPDCPVARHRESQSLSPHRAVTAVELPRHTACLQNLRCPPDLHCHGHPCHPCRGYHGLCCLRRPARTSVNLLPWWGWGHFYCTVFFSRIAGYGGAARAVMLLLTYLFIHHFRIIPENFSPRSSLVRLPGVVKCSCLKNVCDSPWLQF